MRVLQFFQPRSLLTAAVIAVTPIAVGVLATLSGLASTPAVAVDVIGFDRKWLVSVDEARALMASGALVLDARNPALKAAAPLTHAQPILWQELADETGRLPRDDARLTAHLQELGVEAGQPIVVLADPHQGLGEDAQIVWALRSLGHPRIVMVDGGLPALLAAGLPAIQPPFGKGRFVIERREDWTLDVNDLPAHERQGALARLTADIAPELLDADDTLKSRDRIAALLAQRGIEPETVIVADRSSAAATWLTAVLIDLGYDARNLVGGGEFPLTAAN